MHQAAPPLAAAAAAAGVAIAGGGDPREEEAPEYPPPPAYYRLFAPPVPATAAATVEEEGKGGEGDEDGDAAMGGAGLMGEEEDSFPLPPPALPRRGQRVEVFGFPLAFLDEERYDPIVPPEARRYPFAESVTRDDGVAVAGVGPGDAPGSGPGVTVMEVDFRKELKRLQALLVEKIPALLLALRTDAIINSSPSPQAGAGAAGSEPAHVALLGEVVEAVDNMHDILSAYRQLQTLVQMVERMEAQCQEKRAAIAALKSGIGGGKAAAAGASAGLVAALTALVQQGE